MHSPDSAFAVRIRDEYHVSPAGPYTVVACYIKSCIIKCIRASSEDADQMPRFATTDLRLRCLAWSLMGPYTFSWFGCGLLLQYSVGGSMVCVFLVVFSFSFFFCLSLKIKQQGRWSDAALCDV